ncbi:uncharacterized protein [Rutidosis leptorrhynchoides]|uniref:uncharacterized protein n=1 Tax=Rutidosis leptorrhynchoides TaxID=125765 RepID=UPI003A99E1AB
MMKQDLNSNPTTTTVCGQCGIEERKFLHNVRIRGNFRRLCTNCVLRLHPQLFCPACIGVYEPSPPDDAVVCYKCYSSSHPTCVTPPAVTMPSSRGPSPCSACINPNSVVFNLNRIDNTRRAIDVGAARLLLAAAKIAAMSMNKAEVAAAMEAERRSKEAAYTRKRAREALDHVVKLMVKEKRNFGVVKSNNSYKKVINPNNSIVVFGDSNVGNVDNVVNDKTDASSEVLEAALNAVELKENGVVVEGVVNEGQSNGVVGMEADDVVVDSVAENGSVKTDALVSNAQEQALEKVNVVEENSVVNPNP